MTREPGGQEVETVRRHAGAESPQDDSAVEREVGRNGDLSPLAIGLLIVDRDSTRFPNLRDPRNASRIYLQCAALLAKSALAAGQEILFYTNDAATVDAAFRQLNVPDGARVEQRNFISQLPPSTPHRSAHHKLDLLHELASAGDQRRYVFLDLDTVLLRPFREKELPGVDEIGAYDITGMMLAESAGRSAQDLRRVAARTFLHPRWFGGEMLVATGAKLAELTAYLDPIEKRYWNELPHLYHCGDETPVSAALNCYTEAGGRLRELGKGGTVLRWWTALRPFRQPRLEEAVERTVLHLPADKEFLAAMAEHPFEPRQFLSSYRRYAQLKLLLRRLKRLSRLGRLSAQPSYVPSL